MTSHQALTVAQREVILRLRVEITTAGLTRKTLAELLGYPVSKVSALLAGRRPLLIEDITTILTACGWAPHRQEALLRIGETTNTPNVLWLQPDEVCTSLIAYSRDVTRAIHVAPTMLPWPLQITDYTWHATSRTGAPLHLLDRWALVRAVWTWRWKDTNDAMTALIFLHENALQPLTESPLMVQQLRELALMADYPGLSLRIIPTHVGLHPATQGSFVLLHFSDWSPLVYRECGNAAVTIGIPEAVRDAAAVINRLDHAALDEQQSRDMLIAMWHAAHAAANPDRQ